MNHRLNEEINRRRTFAIISHPDAGKTTLTEKLLLYGGALELAGSVTLKKKQRETSSDWMELEKKRGISISSTVLQFEYNGYRMNLLDTPGHKDFSEDTYRVLMAADAVIMVIDAGKGIESQTIKLFEICRKRNVPIYTFMNKLDRPSMVPLDLIDQLEKVLGIHAFPVTWPLDSGPFFKGVYDRLERQVNLFEKVPGGEYVAPVSIHSIFDPFVKDKIGEASFGAIVEELEMLDGAHDGFDLDAVRRGVSTPVFFGSASNNFGIEHLLNGILKYSNPPMGRISDGKIVPVDSSIFSCFVFKVQTNMNPMHRDRMVFTRVCSGKFTRDMTVYNTRSKKKVRLSNSHNIFGRDREIVEEAYPGDILGFITNSEFRIGDTISTDTSIVFNEIPRFAPECFAFFRNLAMSDYKSFRKGLDHLLAEDVVQAFYMDNNVGGLPLLGAVGPLQFEVLQYRLKDEYGVDSNLEMAQWTVLRWTDQLPTAELKSAMPYDSAMGEDELGNTVLLFTSDWSMQYFLKNNSGVDVFESPSLMKKLSDI